MLKYDFVYDYNAWFSRAVVVIIAITTRSSMSVKFEIFLSESFISRPSPGCRYLLPDYYYNDFHPIWQY